MLYTSKMLAFAVAFAVSRLAVSAMVLRFAALPPELRALVATKCDAATAAHFALASRACALLLRQRLAFLLEAHH